MKGWGWYAIVIKLANDDFLKIENVMEQNFIGALNFLAYQKTKENYIKALEEKQKNKTRIR